MTAATSAAVPSEAGRLRIGCGAIMDRVSATHDHVQLLVGYRADGSPSLEMTPA
jgi:hypothetical protein